MKISLILSLLSLVGTHHAIAFAPHSIVGGRASRARGWIDIQATSGGDEPLVDLSKISGAADRVVQGISNYDTTQLQKNLQDGEIGKRGEIYVAGQFALILCIVLGGIPVIGDPMNNVLGALLMLSGGAAGLLSLSDLGSDTLSPFPKPASGGSLKTEGIYSQMRHPMYTSLLCFMLGLSLLSHSADRLLLTTILYYLLEVKSDKEESFLSDRYGSEYDQYKSKVTEKFLPMGLLKLMPWTD